MNEKHEIEDRDVIRDASMTKLLEAINLRANSVSSQHLEDSFPKLDASALYCLGIFIEEYSQYLNTDIITQRRAIDKKKPLKKGSHASEHVVKLSQKEKKTSYSTVFGSFEIQAIRPNIEQELSNLAQRQSLNQTPQLRTTNEPLEYDEIFKKDEWSNLIKVSKTVEGEENKRKRQKKSKQETIHELQEITIEHQETASEQQEVVPNDQEIIIEQKPKQETITKQQKSKKRIAVKETKDDDDIFDNLAVKKKKKSIKSKKKSGGGF